MFVYMFLAGQKILAFFKVVFPIQLVFQLHNVWWLLLLAPTIFVLLRYVVSCEPSRPKQARETAVPTPSTCWLPIKPSVICFLIVLVLHLSFPVLMQWVMQVGCAPCEGKLPKKPMLIAHRGCGFIYPENTILSFVHSSQIPGMIGLESDVQVYVHQCVSMHAQ